MRLARVATEPFVRFLDFKRTFNSQFKVSVAAIFHVSRIVSGAGGKRLMQGLVADTGEPWGKDFNWTNPAADLNAALRDTTRLGLIQVHSAADEMLSSLRADLDRWNAVAPREMPGDGNFDDQADPFELMLVGVLSGSPTAFDNLRPILHYFRLARNCIAHRSSRASPALAEFSRDGSIKAALIKWPKRQGAMPPPLPHLDTNEPIELLPRHAILALEAVYRAMELINRRFVHHLDADGLTYLAAHHVLSVDSQVEGLTAYRSAQAVVADALANRYGVRGMPGPNVILTLKRLGVWKNCVRDHTRLYGNPAQRRDSTA
jgi:hypothetical protein